jgi:hypothetical protein
MSIHATLRSHSTENFSGDVSPRHSVRSRRSASAFVSFRTFIWCSGFDRRIRGAWNESVPCAVKELSMNARGPEWIEVTMRFALAVVALLLVGSTISPVRA